ncbi:MAG TPA: SpoIIE family protein phosphatase, partial [Bacteroidia bacterium]
FNNLREREKKLQALVDQRTYELQRANSELENAVHMIEEKNQKLEIAYKDIRDSINYARKIQQAILPSIHDVYAALEQSFVFYRPKDIVSGDFYFFAEKNKKIMIGVADCTGHGVPGAFMSMIGHDMLNQIIIEKGITSPSEVLNQLESGIRGALKQDLENAETKDGMDIALCQLDMHRHKDDTVAVQYAGAFRNLYIVRKHANEVEEVRADKISIGGVILGDVKKFSNHEIHLQKGDSFYIFSDGYCDQFGGPGGKKFMTRQFQRLLMSIKDHSMKEQEAILERTFKEWKGDLEQVDDILVIGVRV